jgi:hypothetical protein
MKTLKYILGIFLLYGTVDPGYSMINDTTVQRGTITLRKGYCQIVVSGKNDPALNNKVCVEDTLSLSEFQRNPVVTVSSGCRDCTIISFEMLEALHGITTVRGWAVGSNYADLKDMSINIYSGARFVIQNVVLFSKRTGVFRMIKGKNITIR